MKKIVFGFIFLLSSIILMAQQKVEWLDVDNIIKQTEAYGEEGEYEKALLEISKVPHDDSAYFSTLITKSYYLINTNQYEEAIKVTEEGLNTKYHPFKYYFMLNNASAYSGLEDYATAVEKYDEAIVEFPRNHKLYYNKAVILEKMGRLEEASKLYQISITYNPLFANSHLKLAALCYTEHHITQAMMGLSMYLLINPDGSRSFDILDAYNNMVEIKNDSKKHKDVQLSVDDESFEEIDLIINNYAALDNKYKTGSKIDLPVIKQSHAMIKQLENYEGNGGFWDKYYVPFYKFIDEEDLFNDYANTISFSVKNEKYKSIVNKNIPAIKSFLTVYKKRWLEIIGENEAVVEGKTVPVRYLYRNSRLDGFGVYEDGITTGDWQVFNKFGSKSSKGYFDKDGEKHGQWIWYRNNGNIEEQGVYDHGKLSGEYIVYYNNGKVNVVANYKDGKLNGKYKKYFKSGALMELINYKDGKYDGEYLSFYPLGEDFVDYRIVYIDGEINGMAYEYFPNGNVKYEMQFKNGMKEGVELNYYENGEVDKKMNYVNNELEGEYTEYHSNGKLYEKGMYSDGYYVGDWKTYYSNGELEMELTYSNGKIDGIQRTYHKDGKLYYEYTFRKGEIIAYKFFNKDQQIIKEAKKQKGEFFYEGHAPNGNITSEGLYDISGGKIGDWKFYSDNGLLESKEFHDENGLQGVLSYYYPNGEVSSLMPYINDTIQGYYSAFYQSKQLKEQGWYSKGKKVGDWITYYPNGTIESKNYYTNGKLYGMAEVYAVDGKINARYFYWDGSLKTEYYYNPEGSLIEEINTDVDSVSYRLVNKSYNGNINYYYSMLYGKKHGEFKSYYFNGVLRSVGNYLSGEQNGEWKWYYETGELEIVGSYLSGNRDGEWIDYYENGNIQIERFYKMGFLQGKKKFYNEKGVVTQTLDYISNELHGETAFYSEDGNLQLIRYYNYGELIGYSYLDSNSLLLPMFQIDNETAKIIAYFDNGKVSREMEIVAGKIVNDYNEYYYSGQIFEHSVFLDDEKNGLNSTYYPDGTLKEELNYDRGFLTGDVNKYHPNGKLKEHKSLLNDSYNGKNSEYDISGKLIREKIYFDGEVISEINY